MQILQEKEEEEGNRKCMSGGEEVQACVTRSEVTLGPLGSAEALREPTYARFRASPLEGPWISYLTLARAVVCRGVACEMYGFLMGIQLQHLDGTSQQTWFE